MARSASLLRSHRVLASFGDTRGAILVLGLVLGVVLGLAVKTLADVGSAVLERDLAQSAADAAAFESATWHARGMNMVATLNVLLALVLGVLVLWRLATFAVALACLLEAVSLLQQPGSRRREIAELVPLVKLLDEDAQVAGSVVLVGSALHAAQVAVAAYTPVLAAHASTIDTDEAFDAKSATFSAALLPSAHPNDLKSLAACVGKTVGNAEGNTSEQRGAHEVLALLRVAETGPKLTSTSTRLGTPFSLPVEAAELSPACQRATSAADDADLSVPDAIVGSRTLRANLSSQQLRSLRSLDSSQHADTLLQLARALSGVRQGKGLSVFCSATGGDVEALRASLWKLATGLSGLAPEEAKRTLLGRVGSSSLSEAPEPRTLDDARRVWRAWQRALDAHENPERCLRPAQVWSPARNGDGFFRSASVSDTGTDARKTRATAVAHAEMFFDCAGAWDECRSTALWEAGWTARLRRVRSFSALLDPAANADITWADQRIIASWLDRTARQLGVVPRAPSSMDARRTLEFEPETVAETWTFGLIESEQRSAAGTSRPLAEFIARHSHDSSLVH